MIHFIKSRFGALLFLGSVSLISKLLILSTDFFRLHAFGVADLAPFEDLAKHIAQGDGAVSTLNSNYSVYKVTGVVLSVLIRLNPALWKELYVGIELSVAVATSLMFYYLLTLFFKNKWVCLVGAVAYILNPLIAFQSLIVSTESFYLLFFILTFIFMLKSMTGSGSARWLALGAGIALGLTFYTRPYILVALPVFFIFFWTLYVKHQKKIGMYCLIGFALMVFMFQLSLSPRIDAGALSAASAVRRALVTNLAYQHDSTLVLKKQAQWLIADNEKWFLKDYVSFWLERPQLYLESCFKSLGSLYRMSPTQLLHSSLSNKFYMPSIFFYTLLEFTLAIIGVGVMWRSRHRNLLVLFFGIITTFSIFYAFTMAGQIRYRLQWEPLILILTTFGISGAGEYIYKWLITKRS